MSRHLVVCFLLAVITVLLYLPLQHHEFINYDDPSLVTGNPMVKAGVTWDGVRWAFTTTHTGNWHPLTWLSHMLDCELFGLRPGAHHLVSATLHATNAVLLFLLLRFLTAALWPSAIAAALFAWHPLRVQSVAWVSERKDVLSALFALLALLAYARYAMSASSPRGRGARPAGANVPDGRRVAYAVSLTSYALGLMAKPMLVTLPFVMLLLDYGPLSSLTGKAPKGGKGSADEPAGWARWRGLVFEKLPFFALSAVFCAVAVFAQGQSEALISLGSLPLPVRLYHAAIAYADYIVKTVYPVNLAVFYPPEKALSWFKLSGALVLLALVSWAVWRARRRKPYLLVGWLWFLGMLVPVIGLVQVGDQLSADRYTYLPSIGLFVAAVFGIADIVVARGVKALIWGPAALLALIGCSWGTIWQLRFWQDSETLFTRALRVTSSNSVALNNLGAALLQRGKIDEAIDRLKQAVQSQPGNAKAENNLGLALVKVGRFEEAEHCYRQALELSPRYVQAHENLARVYLQTGRLDAAIASLQAATAIEPSDAKSFNDLGVAFMKSGRMNEGSDSFRRAVGLEPNNAVYRKNLANSLLQQGRLDEAKALLLP